jgi:hypothetical protein
LVLLREYAPDFDGRRCCCRAVSPTASTARRHAPGRLSIPQRARPLALGTRGPRASIVSDRHPRQEASMSESNEGPAATIHEQLATEARPAAADRGRLAGKVAVVTGASSGIGRATRGPGPDDPRDPAEDARAGQRVDRPRGEHGRRDRSLRRARIHGGHGCDRQHVALDGHHVRKAGGANEARTRSASRSRGVDHRLPFDSERSRRVLTRSTGSGTRCGRKRAARSHLTRHVSGLKKHPESASRIGSSDGES